MPFVSLLLLLLLLVAGAAVVTRKVVPFSEFAVTNDRPAGKVIDWGRTDCVFAEAGDDVSRTLSSPLTADVSDDEDADAGPELT